MAMGKIEFVAMYGHYRMAIRSLGKGMSQVSMYDVSNLKWPLMWSRPMTNECAEAAKELFENCGYFEVADVMFETEKGA